jgi:putative FmdB family regulatory protein
LPTYEYRCNVCGHQFERTQRMSDDPVRECEVCGGEVARVLFAPAIHFKGTGFHNTDYPSRRRGAEGESGSGGDAAPNGGAGKDAPKEGAAATAKEATPKDTAARTTGP